MNDKDQHFMRAAIQLSAEHMRAGHGGPFGAVIVRNDEIIATGWNQVTSTNDPTAHAEVTAIRAAGARLKNFQLNGCVLYTSCEPCPMCMAASYWARLDRVMYASTRLDAAGIGFDDEELYREIVLPIAQRKLPMQQILHAEATAVMDEWKTLPGKIHY